MLLPFTIRPGSFLGFPALRYLFGASVAVCGLLAHPAQAQAPVVTKLTPTRNALAAPRTTPVTVTFDQALSPASGAGLRVFGALTGQKPGPAVVSGNTLTLPNTTFKAGEVVSVSVTTAVQGSGGQALTRPQVYQFTTATAPSAGRFGGGSDVALSNQVNSAATGDVNGDGKPDYVTVTGITGTVGVGLNQGDGTFAFGPSIYISGSSYKLKLVLGDVDGDGDLDLLTLGNNFPAGRVDVLLNDGQGRFSGTQEVEVGRDPTDLVLGDVDGDGDLDFVVSSSSTTGNVASIRLNNGQGIFDKLISAVNTPANTLQETLGDVDNDGDLDLLLISAQGQVDVQLNDGRGVYSESGNNLYYSLTGSIESYLRLEVFLQDVDADGDLDVLAIGNTNAKVYVLLNDGRGVFLTRREVSVANDRYLAVGDVNGDSYPDLVTVGPLDATARLNDGKGTFTPGQALAFRNANFTSLDLADVNGDGTLDLLATQNGQTLNVRLNLNNLPSPPPVITGLSPARNALAAPRTAPVTVTFDQALSPASGAGLRVFGALTGQKPGPAVVSGNTLSLPAPSFQPGEVVSVSVTTAVQGSGGQALTRPQVYQFTTATAPSAGRFGGGSDVALSNQVNSAATGDVNGDNKVDIVTISTAGQVSISLNQGNGTFRPGPTLSVRPNTKKLLLGDVDGDGDLDLLALSTTVSIRLNDGRGNFSGTQEVPTPQDPTDIALGDVDNDGDLDLVISSYYFSRNTASVWLNNGQGVFDKRGGYIGAFANTYKATLGDVDNDGDLDLLLTDYRGSVQLQMNDGLGFMTYFPMMSFPLDDSGLFGALRSDVLLRDLDSDGDLDIVASGGNKIYIRLNDGNGAFTTQREVAISNPGDLAVADVNGDGYPDLVTIGLIGTIANVHLNDGKATFSPGQTLVLSDAPPISLALADVNGDGTLDLLATRSDQMVSVRLNPATTITPPTPPINTAATRLNAGGPALTTSLGTFTADQYFSASSATATTSAPIAGTPDPALYQSERYGTNGTLAYALPVANGHYSVVLHFAEIYWTKPGQRVFDAALEGKKVLDHFDIVQKVGPLAATTETFTVTVTDGVLNLNLTVPYLSGGADQPKLSALEVVPAAPVAVRLNAGGPALTTTRGAFAADQYYSTNSRAASTTASISGTPDPALYQTERYSTNGQLSYAVPVANGRYSVVLHFSENYWKQPGQRVFNINLEGQQVVTNYDILAKVAPLTATTETFTVTVTDGVLNVDLRVPYGSGGADQAKLSALEVRSANSAPLAANGSQSATATTQEAAMLAAALSAYPNPAPGNFTLSLTSPTVQTATLILTDQLGRVVQQQAVPLQAGANQVPVQAAGLATGLYQLRLRMADGQRLSTKVSLRP